MKVKIIKDFRMREVPTVLILAGSTLDTTEGIAGAWMAAGVAVVDVIETATSKAVTETAVTHDVAEKKREQTRERVRRYREKQKGVTQ